MKKFCILIAMFIANAVNAERIGDVEFEFPKSDQEWVLLTDSHSFTGLEEIKDSFHIKFFTHRNGDALELLTMVQMIEDNYVDAEEEEEPFQTAQFAEIFINDLLKETLPNHQINISKFKENRKEGFVEWEVSDGIQQVIHGISRLLNTKNNTILISYLTTAIKTEENTALWTDLLLKAKSID
jgi:hypothetical protein